MRHDSHFVDSLSERFGLAVGKYLPIGEIEPNPHQPRHSVGDLRELKASIENKGVLEPILVLPIEKGKYRIISGERRYRAALEAGLAEIPCIELDVPENEVVEIALIENLHRKDLTPFEEAEGFQSLISRFGYTHQKIADAIGKSRVSITESLSLLSIPPPLREACRRADIGSKRLLLEVARAGSAEAMERVLAALAAGGSREMVREEKKDAKAEGGASRRRAFRFRYAPRDSPFRLSLAFNRSRVGREDVIEALKKLISELQDGSVSLKGSS
jgi:ParB family chromosome partitioning protein